MQGDLIFEDKGKVTGRRVLSETAMEVSFEAKSKTKGFDGMDMGTYTTTMMPDGSMYGQGCFMSNDGQIVTWKGNGIGRFVEQSKIRYVGAIYLSTSPRTL